jgi:lipoprotein Spr
MLLLTKHFVLCAFIIIVLLASCISTSTNRATRFDENDGFNVSCQNIMQVAQYWLGVPYRYGGSDYNGVDCSGFVQLIYKETFDISLPRTTDAMFSEGDYVRSARFNCGDLLFFRDVRGRGVDHVGIYIGDNRFIHASTTQGVTISNLDNSYYREHFVAARRYF